MIDIDIQISERSSGWSTDQDAASKAGEHRGEPGSQRVEARSRKKTEKHFPNSHCLFWKSIYKLKVSFGAVTTGCFRHLEIPLFPLFKCVLPFPQVPTVPLDAEDEVDNVEDIVEVLGQIILINLPGITTYDRVCTIWYEKDVFIFWFFLSVD